MLALVGSRTKRHPVTTHPSASGFCRREDRCEPGCPPGVPEAR
jgi:hypothetical protein